MIAVKNTTKQNYSGNAKNKISPKDTNSKAPKAAVALAAHQKEDNKSQNHAGVWAFNPINFSLEQNILVVSILVCSVAEKN